MQILEAKKLIWKQKVWNYFQHHSVSFEAEHEIPSYHNFTIMPQIFHMTTRVWVKHREVRVCVHDIMVCYDLEAIFGEGKNIRSPCVQWYVQCTVHCTVGVQHEWSPSVSQLWPEHRMETTGSEDSDKWDTDIGRIHGQRMDFIILKVGGDTGL